MQNRCAPAALARAASAITACGSINRPAWRPVSKWADWLQ